MPPLVLIEFDAERALIECRQGVRKARGVALRGLGPIDILADGVHKHFAITQRNFSHEYLHLLEQGCVPRLLRGFQTSRLGGELVRLGEQGSNGADLGTHERPVPVGAGEVGEEGAEVTLAPISHG